MTPEIIEAAGKAIVGVIAAFGAIVATIASAVAAFYTWKNRYELDKLYAATYRPNADGTPGPMRSHPPALVKLFCRKDQAAKGGCGVDLEPRLVTEQPAHLENSP